MVDIKDIQKFIKDRKAKFIQEIRIRPNDGSLVATISNSSIGEKAIEGKTSWRQLTYIRKAIKEKFNTEIEFVISKSEVHGNLENGLLGILEQKFPTVVLLCFLSFPKSGFADVWMEFREPESVSESSREQIQEVVEEYLKLSDVNHYMVHWGLGELSLPTTVAILRAIKITAPADLGAIENNLSQNAFSWPSQTWLKNKLDLFRKKGLLLRQQDESYVLTQETLSKIPHGNFRTSSDVERALALGRRKW